MKTIGIIGSGSYCTSFVKIITDPAKRYSQDIHINWFIRNQDTIDHILQHKHNPKYLTSVEIPVDKIQFFADIKSCIQSSEILILGVPSAFLYNTLRHCTADDFKDKKIVTLIKGVVPETNQIVADFMTHHFNIPISNVAMISGPSHAEEIAGEKLTYLTIAAPDSSLRNILESVISNDYIKTFQSDDLSGAEFASVLKNIFAVAAGIYHGLGYGDNFHAFFMTNAIKELKKFVNTVSPANRDIEDSVYLGDLLVTCYSAFSRNRMFGNYIGKGYTVKVAQSEMNMIAEGYFATKCIYEINQHYHVDLPILDAVYNILYKNAPVRKEMESLTLKLS